MEDGQANKILAFLAVITATTALIGGIHSWQKREKIYAILYFITFLATIAGAGIILLRKTKEDYIKENK